MNQHSDPDPTQSRERGKIWARVAASATGIAAIASVLLIQSAAAEIETTRGQVETQNVVIARQNGVISEVCQAAKDRADTTPAAQDACGRVERGLPAIGEFTVATSSGQQRCVRDGGSDAVPNYACTLVVSTPVTATPRTGVTR